MKRMLGAYEGRPFRRGLIAAAVAVMLGVGAGAATAYWSASVTATSTATSAQLAITTANFTSNAYTFGNDNLATTGSVTVTNTTSTTSTKLPTLALAFSSSAGSTDLPGDVKLTVWYQASGTCTAATAVGAGAVTGTWASFAGLNTTLAKTVAATFCVRSTITDRQDAAVTGGTMNFTPQIAATLTVNNFTATATATAPATQKTQYIYPLTAIPSTNWYAINSSGMCMDVSGGGTSATGTAVISYGCHQGTNQQWQFVQDGTTGYYDITPRSGTTTSVRADVNGATTSGSAVTVRTDSASTGQLWQPQLISAGTYQFVNKLTGMCLTSTATSAGNITQAICDGSNAQKVTLTVTATTGPVMLQNLICSTTGSGGSKRVTYSWTSASNGGYTVQAERTAGNWYAIATTTATTASSSAIGGNLPTTPSTLLNWSQGNHAVRILNGAGETVGTSNVTIDNTFYGFGTDFLACS